MQHKLTLTTTELIVIRESLHSITIKGVDAPIVAGVLDKVYKGIEKAASEQQRGLANSVSEISNEVGVSE